MTNIQIKKETGRYKSWLKAARSFLSRLTMMKCCMFLYATDHNYFIYAWRKFRRTRRKLHTLIDRLYKASGVGDQSDQSEQMSILRSAVDLRLSKECVENAKTGIDLTSDSPSLPWTTACRSAGL
jgi:hypothetical protein